MGSRRHSDPAFREELANSLRIALDRRDLSVAKVAEAVGVSRQAFYQYLNGKTTPRGEVLRKLVPLLDLKLEYSGHVFDKGAFTFVAEAQQPYTQMRLSFDEPLTLRGEKLRVTVVSRKEKTIELVVAVLD